MIFIYAGLIAMIFLGFLLDQIPDPDVAGPIGLEDETVEMAERGRAPVAQTGGPGRNGVVKKTGFSSSTAG